MRRTARRCCGWSATRSTDDPVLKSISLVGHPYAPIGMGEHVRCTFRALRSVAQRPSLHDIYGLIEPDAAYRRELVPFSSDYLSPINVFHINGDEVEQSLAHVDSRRDAGYNIIYPAWELARYPDAWARQLERFDEIWAPSAFIRASIASSTERPVHHMPLACEVVLTSFLGRRYFKIPEASYVFLFFFDLRSYVARKNPQAVVEAFRRLVARRPNANVSLVIKVNGADVAPDEFRRLEESVADIADRTILIGQAMSDNEVKNLVRCCDCFVSLHRSEGFGRGIAEAMYLDKPVIATGYSGNMDFMAEGTCFPVTFELVPVPEGAYPFWEGQVWADASVDDAVGHMSRLVDEPGLGYDIGRKAGHFLRTRFGLRPTGNRFMRRLEEIAASRD